MGHFGADCEAMIPDLTERERRRELTVIDGGTGTELRRRGFPVRDDVWTALAAVTHYPLLRDIHADFLRAGADVITANTFATTRFVLEGAGLAALHERLNRRSVAAALEARAAVGRAARVAGSLSCLPPAFDVARYPPAAVEARDYHALADLLADAGCDLLVLEMMQDTVHAPRACAAARASGLPFWLGVSARLEGDRLVAYDLPDVPLEASLDALLPYEPAAVCIMHTPLDAVLPALDLLRTRWPGPLGAYPELGVRPGFGPGANPEPRPDTFSPFSRPDTLLVAEARGWVAAGATIVGGCCGTTPADIRGLAELRG